METEERRSFLVMLVGLDDLDCELLDLMEKYWDDERMWNELAESRTHVLIARTKIESMC